MIPIPGTSLFPSEVKFKFFHLFKYLIILLYCSLSKLEGEEQILKFLEKNKNFTILPIDDDKLSQSLTKEGFLRILPQHLKDFSGTDGFFVACLKRKN